MQDFHREALQLIQALAFDPDGMSNPELLSMKFGLYARLLTFLDTAIRHTQSNKLRVCASSFAISSSAGCTWMRRAAGRTICRD